LSHSAPSSAQAEFPARLAALPDTAVFAQAFCERNGIGRDDALRLTLVIEELFTNTVQHGYRDESDAPIRISLAIGDGRVTLLYEDSAPRYDPLAQWSAPPSGLAAPIESRPVGGLGVYLLGQLVAGARYAYENGSNRLWLEMPRGG
jgi:anti-sigma regulatory factor (Ser/Thr protein kinase)